LISGVFIVMDPGKSGGYRSIYKGLAEPPAIQSDDQGSQFILSAEALNSLDIGSPVYYRQLKVGEVTGYKLREKGAHVEIRIFIKAPHDKLVFKTSRFWNVSGINVTVGSEGVRTQIGSLVSIIAGGLAFENGAGLDAPERAAGDHEFYLYPDRNSLMDEQYSLKHFYLLKFSNSVRGLQQGAAVEFRGIQIGNVVDVKLNSVNNQSQGLYVYIAIEPQRLDPTQQPTRDEFDKQIDALVKQGLRAQLKTASLITGARLVDLTFPLNPAKAEFTREEKYGVIPSAEESAADLGQQLGQIAESIQKIPLEKIGTDVSRSMESIGRLLAVLEKQNTADKLDKTLGHLSVASEQLDATLKDARTTMKELSTTLNSLDGIINPDSPTQYELRTMLESVESAAQTLERLTEKLNQKPDALIFGDP
jgi:paraquat-inducible protein B